VPPAPVLTRRDNSANSAEVVDTSRDISDAVVRKRRSSAMAGSLAAALLLLFAALLECLLDMLSPASCGEEADNDADVVVAPPRMEVIAPVAGMAWAMAKNSLVRSAMVIKMG